MRSNKKLFLRIEAAINLANKGLIQEAGKLCYLLKVPFDVAHRVILKPHKRRKVITLTQKV